MAPAHTVRTWRSLPLVLLVTALVAVLPIALVWELRASGAVGSAWLAVLLAGTLSLASSFAARTYWTRHPHRNDLVFSELLLWGWLSRWHTARQLENAGRLLGVFGGAVNEQLAPRRRTQLLRRLANALDAQDAYLDGHSRRVARHTEKIARRMGMSRADAAKLRAAAAIHDVGKLHVPRSILDKPGKLTDAEFDVMKLHPVEGAVMVRAIGDPELTEIVRHHHERIDGKGYPDGLHAQQIPIGARIVAVADTFDAITSPRPYRPAARHRDAIRTLREVAGTQLDPDAVRAFLGYYAGRRHVLLCTALLEMPQQAVARLVGAGSSIGAISSSNVLATVAATAAVGAAAAGVPAHGHTAKRSHSASARVAALVASPDPLAGAFRTAAGTAAATYVAPAARHHGAGRTHHPTTTRRLAATAPRRRSAAGSGAAPSSTPSTTVSTTSTSTVTHAHGTSTAAARRHHGATIHRPAHRFRHWTPPGRSGIPAPGRNPSGPPGKTGATPGQSGTPAPGLRGATPPGKAR